MTKQNNCIKKKIPISLTKQKETTKFKISVHAKHKHVIKALRKLDQLSPNSLENNKIFIFYLNNAIIFFYQKFSQNSLLNNKLFFPIWFEQYNYIFYKRFEKFSKNWYIFLEMSPIKTN